MGRMLLRGFSVIHLVLLFAGFFSATELGSEHARGDGPSDGHGRGGIDRLRTKFSIAVTHIGTL
eukprot:1040332-Pleurochrysis_carterae.AAC.1